MKLFLAAFHSLLLLVPVPVPPQRVCQHKLLWGRMVNEGEEGVGLKITRSLSCEQHPGLTHTVSRGNGCCESRALVHGVAAAENVCQAISRDTATWQRPHVMEGRARTDSRICQIHGLYVV